MLEEILWVISFALFIVAGGMGFISMLCVPDKAEEAYWIEHAAEVGLVGCIFALIAMWIY